MSTTVTFEQAINSLQSMFPDYEKGVLAALLQGNNCHVENTIETILRMEGVGGEVPISQAPSSSSYTPPPSASTSSPSSSSSSSTSSSNRQPAMTADFFDGEYVGAAGAGGGEPTGAVGSAYGATRHQQQQQQQQQAPKGRGITTRLPEDFLRPPGWQESNMTLGDEQLALMLQNEMFAREVQQALGTNFLDGRLQMQRGGGGVPGRDSRAVFTSGRSGSMRQQQGQGQGQQQQQQQQQEGIPDMGILKGLSSMSSAARSSLNQLALRFSSFSSASQQQQQQQQQQAGSVGTGEGRASIGGSGSSSSSVPEDARSLIRGGGDDDDDEEGGEVISFGGSGSTQMSELNSSSSTSRTGGVGGRSEPRHRLEQDFSSSSSTSPMTGGFVGKKDR